MTVSTSRLAYTDCYDIMDRALADGKGCRVKFKDADDAYNFRLRLYVARKIDRVDNAEIYDPPHPLHGRSEYDGLVSRVRQDAQKNIWLYVEVLVSRNLLQVEDLSNGVDKSSGSDSREDEGEASEGAKA